MDRLKRAFRGGKRQLTAAEMGKARPVRKPELEWATEEDGSVRIQAPIPGPKGVMMRYLAEKMKSPSYRVVELEPIGAMVWHLSDGQHSVAAIAKQLQKQFGMNRLESEASLNAFLQMLGQRGLIELKISQ